MTINDFAGRTVFVSGGSSGINLGIARASRPAAPAWPS